MTEPASLAHQNEQLRQEIKQHLDQLTAINAVVAAAAQSSDLKVTLDFALDTVLQIASARAVSICVMDAETQELTLYAHRESVCDLQEQPLFASLGLQALRANQAMIDNHVGDLTAASPDSPEAVVHSLAIVPMRAGGQIIGLLSVISDQPNHFAPDLIPVLQTIADTAGAALNHAQLQANSIDSQIILRVIFDTTTDGIITADQKGQIRHINDQAERMLGLQRHKLFRTPLREIPLNSQVRDPLLRALEQCMSKPETFEVTLEIGQTLSITVSPISPDAPDSPSSAPDGWIIVFRDVTHRREAELARTQFVAAAAHDMRSPISITMNALKLIESMMDTPDPTIAELMTLAESGIIRLQALIDDVLRLEQIESGYGTEPEAVDIGDLVRETIYQMKSLLQTDSVSLHVEIEDNLPQPVTDRQLLRRAIANYLDNAAKYGGAGAVIQIRAFFRPPLLHVEVTDNGPGIPQQDQLRLFERFYRAPTTRSLPGTGLGLAIVKSIAQQNGGDVYVRSAPGQGSTFGMTLAVSSSR